jgi:hypothetical protein
MTAVNSLTNYVDAEGRELQVRLTRLSSTSVKISWNVPEKPYVYAGAIVLASLTELNPSNFPTDSVRYSASADFNVPADRVGSAHVVGAYYDDMVSNEVTITNLPENDPVYVAVHLATNVYTYYGIGVRSYPDTQLSSAWAPHVENIYGPPDNPEPGQVYYDPTQRMMFAWNGTAWLPSTAHTVITGEVDPTAQLQIYSAEYSGLGDGGIHSSAVGTTAIEEQVWTIMAVSPTIFTVTGSTLSIKPSAIVGVPYSNGYISFLIEAGPTAYIPGDTYTVTVKSVPLTKGLPTGYPKQGDFFYNSRDRRLKCWSGTAWVESEEPKKGVPTYQRINIGDNGEPGPRDTIKDILKRQLGYPKVCVELDEEQFDIALNNALQELRRRVDSAYYKQYFFLTIVPGQQLYYLNDPTKGLDGIVDVLKIHRLNMLGLVNFGPDNLYAQQFLNQFYSPGVGYDLVSIHLIHSLSETYTQLFAGDIAFNWREARRELTTYRTFGHMEKVLVECSMEKTEQELLIDRWTQQWIQQWAESELMFMLAHIRGKFSSLPGPGGGLSLNADMLMSEGQRLQEDCVNQVKNYEVGQNGPDNFHMPFVIG